MEDVLNIGQLVSIKWQIGVSVQSNHCENLNAPFVSVQLQVQDPNQEISTHSFDLSLLEFKVKQKNKL